jgi:hypothetical protein
MTTELITLPDAKKIGALVYINEGHLNPVTPLYKTEVTAIKIDIKNDCYNISGKLMVKREIVDRVAEASAISYIPSGCRTWTETRDDAAGKRTVFISEQQGKMRLPDGSYRTSSVQAYEFDPNLRAMLDVGVDEWNEKTKQQRKDNAGKTVAMRAMEYAKFGRQRAETGARLRVIKEMTGMPTAFNSEEAARAMVFCRVVQNTDYLLSTPEGRMLAAAQATGMQDAIAGLYGKQGLPGPAEEGAPEMRNVTEGDAGTPEQTTAALAAEAAGDEWDNLKPASKPDEFMELSLQLEEYLQSCADKINVPLKKEDGTTINPYQIALAELENPKATTESRKNMIGRIERLVKKLEATA